MSTQRPQPELSAYFIREKRILKAADTAKYNARLKEIDLPDDYAIYGYEPSSGRKPAAYWVCKQGVGECPECHKPYLEDAIASVSESKLTHYCRVEIPHEGRKPTYEIHPATLYLRRIRWLCYKCYSEHKTYNARMQDDSKLVDKEDKKLTLQVKEHLGQQAMQMLADGTLNSVYDPAKVDELEEQGAQISVKDKMKLDKLYEQKPVYEAIISALQDAVSDEIYLSPEAFMPVLRKALAKVTDDKKLLDKIADGLSVMDKNAEIQRDKHGAILYDKDSKDTEFVPYEESIDEYMAREVLPHVPDAKAFWEEKVDAKKPVIKTGAEIPFTQYFYKYEQPVPSEELAKQFTELEQSVSQRIAKLFG